MNKVNLLQNVLSLQVRVNNLGKEKPRNLAYAKFKMKQRNIFGLALIDSGNLVHSSIVSADFWESIGGKLAQTMDYRVGTADGQSQGLQVLGIGEPWPIFLEGMEECYILKPLVIKGLSHSVNLGFTFFAEYRLKLSCYEDGPTLESIADDKVSLTILVDGECLDFENRKSGKTLRATREQEISTQAWRIPREKVTINILKDGVEENVGV